MKLAADFTEGWTSPRNKRRYAAVLIAAWAVFWLFLAGQPCCEAFALTPDHAKSQSASDASHPTGHAHPDGHGADSNPGCPEVIALDSVTIDSTHATVDRPLIASIASDVTFIPTRDAASLQRELYGPPPPPIALYLRNLHLLI